MFYKGEKVAAAASANTDLHGHGDEIRKELGKRIPREKKLRVLDVGTGFGINVVFLAKWLSRGSSVWTVDPSKEVLRDVRATLESEAERRVHFVEASADDLEFSDGFFDFVVSVMVLHHIQELRPALREMARVLKSGGTLIVVDYKPQAAQELEFQTRHDESDFFKPETVVKGIRKFGMVGRPKGFGMWYLVEAKKPWSRASRASRIAASE